MWDARYHAATNPLVFLWPVAVLTVPNIGPPAVSVDSDTVRRIAHLARIRLDEDRIEPMREELNTILAFVEQLDEVNTDGVEPMTSVVGTKMRLRPDVVTDGNIPDDVVANAPASEDGFFMVPKVVE